MLSRDDLIKMLIAKGYSENCEYLVDCFTEGELSRLPDKFSKEYLANVKLRK